MSIEKLNQSLVADVEALINEGRAKAPERIIVDYLPPKDNKGPRYKLRGSDKEFIRMNSNSYLSLSNHPDLIKVADEATHKFGVGPGAVRFIDGTFSYHADLEERIAKYMNKPAAKIFNSAYTANLAQALAINSKNTYWVGDAFNHNSIIRAMRICGVASENKAIYKHNDMADLESKLSSIPEGIDRVVVIFDGIFSMRGDFAPVSEINTLCKKYENSISGGIVTVIDDSHGIGAFGETGRGTVEYAGATADIIIGTFGKAFGVNGGFVASSPEVIEAIRQKSDTYIYTNPLSVADCAAALKGVEIADSSEGIERLTHLHQRIKQFREGLDTLGLESIPGPHPVIPIMVRDTAKTHKLVKHLYDKGILVVGLTFPVVPKGDETIRTQINSAHTEADINYALKVLSEFEG